MSYALGAWSGLNRLKGGIAFTIVPSKLMTCKETLGLVSLFLHLRFVLFIDLYLGIMEDSITPL
jgi:hypothetical protein